MSPSSLEKVRAQLMAIAAADVRPAPFRARNLSVAALTVVAALTPPRRARLAAIGYPTAAIDELGVFAHAATEAMALALADSAVDGETATDRLVTMAEPLRDEMVRACRYHLRHQAGMVLKLEAVAESTGVLDLAFDLDVLAHMIELEAGAFASNPSFDVSAQVLKMRSLAHEIRNAVAIEGAARASFQNRDLRDRAYTALWMRFRDLQAAVLYGLPDDSQLLAMFRVGT